LFPEQGSLRFIPQGVIVKLVPPKSLMCFRGAWFTVWTSVPEATVNKNSQFDLWKIDIWPARQCFGV
jgi:hypothetical protein